MNRKELTEMFMMISNRKKPFALQGLYESIYEVNLCLLRIDDRLWRRRLRRRRWESSVKWTVFTKWWSTVKSHWIPQRSARQRENLCSTQATSATISSLWTSSKMLSSMFFFYCNLLSVRALSVTVQSSSIYDPFASTGDLFFNPCAAGTVYMRFQANVRPNKLNSIAKIICGRCSVILKTKFQRCLFVHKYNYFSSFGAGNCVSNSSPKWGKIVQNNSAA